ncbi:CIC11C00000004025 [Sungouiella intermedia]|uniref:CIC11C00000004025 n=1 Tax=Sungouiella intermedia TaxID=45354 RepID=A0A1L0BZV5_9ASCO|nr:CIC11C00000004025 [[Candida] intermedia]
MRASFLLYIFLVFALVSASRFSPFDSPDFCLQIITPTCNTTFSYIDTINEQIRPVIVKIVHSPFFRYFKFDLDKQCKFWNAQHFCATRNCAVEILPTEQFNWSHVPDDLRPLKLGEIQRNPATEDEQGVCEDLDYSHIDEGHDCVFVDLIDNPERFTGYGGAQSLDVWKAIYSENCFPNTNPMSMLPDLEPEQCVEKNLFYRLISGMHASIGVHLSNEYLDPTTEKFGPNLKVFMERVGKFNDRLSNIYFNYALVSQAIVKLSDLVLLPEYIDSSNETVTQLGLLQNEPEEPAEYNEWLHTIKEQLGSETLFEAHSLFDPATVDPELKNEFRSRFRNVSAIMDCVGCDRCRMWGKLQTIGYGTALKILFELEDPTTSHLLKVRRIELVALFNTLDRLSKSIASINNFKKMYLLHLEDVAAGIAKHGDYEPLHDKGLEFPFVSIQPKTGDKEKIKEKVQSDQKAAEEIYNAEGQIYNTKSTKQGFWEEVENVKLALNFVLKSYVDFPKRLYQLAMYYANGWWNVYVGKAKYVPQSDLKLTLKDEL